MGYRETRARRLLNLQRVLKPSAEHLSSHCFSGGHLGQNNSWLSEDGAALQEV